MVLERSESTSRRFAVGSSIVLSSLLFPAPTGNLHLFYKLESAKQIKVTGFALQTRDERIIKNLVVGSCK